MGAANRFLEDAFLPDFNARFAVEAAQPEDGHRRSPDPADLACIVSIPEPRVVAKDWTIRWRNRVLQLPCEAAEFIQSGRQVTVCDPLHGPILVTCSTHRKKCFDPGKVVVPLRNCGNPGQEVFEL